MLELTKTKAINARSSKLKEGRLRTLLINDENLKKKINQCDS